MMYSNLQVCAVRFIESFHITDLREMGNLILNEIPAWQCSSAGAGLADFRLLEVSSR